MRKILILMCIWSSGVTLFAQSKFLPVEELTYNAYYNWGFIWLKAGQVDFSLSASEKYPGAQRLQAIGYSLPSWDWMFTVRDTLVSHHDPHTFMPYEFARVAHEGNYHKTYDYIFNYQDSLIIGDVHRIGKYRKTDTVKLEPNTYDMLSVAWQARELDFDNYKVNDSIPIKILIDSKIYPLYVRYLGIEKIKAGGKKQECYVFAPLLVKGKVFKGGEDMRIWVSKDEYRIPVMVEAKILVGSVKAIIDRKASNYGIK